MRIEVVDYQASWPGRFADVAAELRDVFGDLPDRIDHIGSTAVPGLAAKPVIDVQVSLPTLHDTARFEPSLVSRSFVLVRNDDRRKWFASRRAPDVAANVHLRRSGEFSQQAALLFRDYLRASGSARDRYQRAKRRLARRSWPSADDYAEAKGDVVWELLREADRWAWQGWEPAEA